MRKPAWVWAMVVSLFLSGLVLQAHAASLEGQVKKLRTPWSGGPTSRKC